MISIRSSSLDDYPSCPRRFAARWLLDAKHELATTHRLRRTRPNIGAIVGTGFHKGVAYLLEQFKATGLQGSMRRIRAAQETAIEEIKNLMREPVTTDTATPTGVAAIATTFRLVERYHYDVRHEHEPHLIERGLKVEFTTACGTVHQITSTVDNYLINGVLEDTKSGVNKPAPFAQFGSYSMAIRANGLPLTGGKVRYGKRVALNKPQPSIETIPVDPMAFEKHALAIARQAAGGLMRLLASGDPDEFLANPRDRLCGAKWCPAYGTTFCPLGAVMKGE